MTITEVIHSAPPLQVHGSILVILAVLIAILAIASVIITIDTNNVLHIQKYFKAIVHNIVGILLIITALIVSDNYFERVQEVENWKNETVLSYLAGLKEEREKFLGAKILHHYDNGKVFAEVTYINKKEQVQTARVITTITHSNEEVFKYKVLKEDLPYNIEKGLYLTKIKTTKQLDYSKINSEDFPNQLFNNNDLLEESKENHQTYQASMILFLIVMSIGLLKAIIVVINLKRNESPLRAREETNNIINNNCSEEENKEEQKKDKTILKEEKASKKRTIRDL